MALWLGPNSHGTGSVPPRQTHRVTVHTAAFRQTPRRKGLAGARRPEENSVGQGHAAATGHEWLHVQDFQGQIH